MIITTLLTGLLSAIAWVTSRLPAFTAPDTSSLTDGAVRIGHTLGWMGGFLNVTFLLVVLGVVAAAWGTYFTVTAALFVWRLIPIVGH